MQNWDKSGSIRARSTPWCCLTLTSTMPSDAWLSHVGAPPRKAFCIHGEPNALEATATRLGERGWNTYVPRQGERVEL